MNADVVDAESRALAVREDDEAPLAVRSDRMLFPAMTAAERASEMVELAKVFVGLARERDKEAKAQNRAPLIIEMVDKKSGRKSEHLTIGLWQTLGALLPRSVTAIPEWTKPIDGGFEARAVVQTLDGQIIGAAEHQCTRDEGFWKFQTAGAIRSMAQTRAQSKALSGVLRFLVILAGFSGTPAEEMGKEPSPPSEPPPKPGPTAEEEAHRKGVEAVLDLCHKLGRATPAREDLERATVPELRTLWEGIKRAGSAAPKAPPPLNAVSGAPAAPPAASGLKPPQDFPAPGGPPMEPKTQRHLFALLGELGYTDHASYHGWIASQGLGPHADAVASFADLSQRQAEVLVRLATEERGALKWQCPACESFDRTKHGKGCPEA